MKESYKVIGSMLALGQFTVKDLELYSGVTSSTVYTVLTRNKEIFEDLGIKANKRRGGQQKYYRLREDKIPLLRKEIEDFVQKINPSADEPVEGAGKLYGSEKVQLPISLLAGEEALLHLFPKAKNLAEKRVLLSSAMSGLKSGRYEVEMLSSADKDVSIAADAQELMARVKALKALSEAELAAESGQDPTGSVNLRSVFDQLIESIQYLSERRESIQADALKERMLSGPLLKEFFREPSVPAQAEDNNTKAAVISVGAAASAAADTSANRGAYLKALEQLSTQHRIAVLPTPIDFVGEEYLQYGVTSGIARSLSFLPDLTVKLPHYLSIRREQVDDIKAIQAIGHDLKVDTVLSGLVETTGSHFRCLARLIDTDSGQVWQEQYERSYIDIFKVGEEISRTVASHLDITLPDARAELISTPTTEDSVAQKLYMEGQYNWSQWTAKGFRKAILCYERALAKDPVFSLAYAGQANCYNMLTDYTSKSPRSAFTKAKAAAYEALEYNESLAEAYASLACARMRYYWKWADAEQEFHHALSINPSYTLARQWFAEYLTAMGRSNDAINQIKLAQDLEPNSPINSTTLGSTYFFARQYESAIKQFEQVLQCDPNLSRALFSLGIVHTQMGNHEEAVSRLRKAVQLFPNSTRGLAALGCAFALGGHKGEAKAIVDLLLRKSSQKYISLYSLAPIHIALGEKDAALDRLEEAVEHRDPSLIFLNVDPRVDEIRENPRFHKVAAEVGLAA